MDLEVGIDSCDVLLLQVFRLPNPWTMAMMNVLAELHREPDMKLNLKFEIEVLCKNLQIDINVSYQFSLITFAGNNLTC
jgi:CCR4-NOT transcription complex subunit 1 CAF1-binding domain